MAVPRLLTVIEAAEILRLSRNKVLRLVEKGELPSVRIPGDGERAARVLLREDSLMDCIERWSGSQEKLCGQEARRRSSISAADGQGGANGGKKGVDPANSLPKCASRHAGGWASRTQAPAG